MAAPHRRAPAHPVRRAAFGVALCCVLCACTASLDFERARRLLRRPATPELPTLQSGEGTADLPRPERLRATSGELREVPLKWDPVLVHDVGGYLIERAQQRDGPFERLAPVAGGLTTTYIDQIETAPDEAAAMEPAIEPTPEDATPAPTAEAAGAGVAKTAQADALAAADPQTDAGAARESDAKNAGGRASADAPAKEAPDTLSKVAPVERDDNVDTAASVRALGPDGVTYYYRVRAFTTDGELSTQASDVVAATSAPLPNPPEDLRVYSHQPRRVPLSWRASADTSVSRYRVDRSPTSLGPFEVVAELDGRHTTTFVDRGLGDLRVFYYRVTAINAGGGVGQPTEPVRAVTKPDPLPPIGPRVLAQRLGANRLGWELNVEPDVTEYRLLRLREGAETPEVVSNIPQGSTETLDRAVGAGERVVYTLVAFDRDGLQSAPSDPVEVLSEGYDLRATTGPDGVRLEWNPRRDEGYRGARIFRSGLIAQREFPPVSGSSFVDSEVKPGGTYRYSVSLLNSSGVSAPRSRTLEVRVPEDAP